MVGLLLGRLLETNLLRSWQISGGDAAYVLERPGAVAILAVMVASIALTALSRTRRRRREAAERGATPGVGS